MAEGKFYWLKLKRDFFKRHDIRIIEELSNGKEYILFYLKLLLESIDHEGALRFSDTVPYNEQMLSVITNTNVDVVRSAMKIFVELNMIEVLGDETIFMAEVDKLIGSETKWAKKKRIQRSKGDNVPQLSSKCPIELEKEIDIDKEIELEKELNTTTTTGEPPSMTEVYLYFREFVDNASKEAEKFHAYNSHKGWTCLPDWKATADLWIARIDERE